MANGEDCGLAISAGRIEERQFGVAVNLGVCRYAENPSHGELGRFSGPDRSCGQFPRAATFIGDHQDAIRFVDDAGLDGEV